MIAQEELQEVVEMLMPPLGRIKITEDMCEHAIQAIYLHADALRNTKFKL